MRLTLLAFSSCLLASSAFAEGIDRDALLTEAPAVPDAGTVRVSASGQGQATGAADSGSTGGVSATVLWAPIERVSGDVGLYAQGPDSGPTARVRFQLLKQSDVGLDLSIGARYKKLGFFRSNTNGNPTGEFEFLLATGRRIGALDLALNAVFGMENGGPGKDLEGKAYTGYRVLPNLRLGLDGRVQAEFVDEKGTKKPDFANDVDLRAGPAVSWLLFKNALQIQALVGVAKPKGIATVSPGAMLAAAMDL